jgi:TP901 family phage tail tape measure protein
MVMSGLTIRSYVKMAFDQGSYTKTQQDYNSALAKLQKSGIGALKGANAELKAAHDKLEAELNRSNQAATQRMKRRSAEVAAQLQADAAKSRPKTVPGDHRITKMGEVFKRDAEKYKQALAKMRAANRAFQSDMQKAGVNIKFNRQGDLDQAHFMGMDYADRESSIEIQKARMAGMDRRTRAYKREKRILDQIVAAHRNKNVLEREEGRIISDNERKRRFSLSALKAGLRENNQLYREQLQMQMQINSTLRRGIQHLQTGLVNALMASSIALMSFGFKLQGVVSTFQEFEKELMNAQSIFQTTNDILFSLSDEIVNFGTQYGISLGTASEGLYTLASAGLSASDSQEVLANTLKLSMAVQGDHDTIAKLTTQTIFGFGLQMSDSAALTDKFAHAINMSLIEYQDLASAVKFAMPFFVSTGQNIDQLLGSLQVLTNRALEAGIAGRGLRQALAEFAQHAQDSEAAFRKLGVEIMDSEGNFKMLTDIAMQFKQAMGPAASDVDLMTTLLEDLNVRGATAFVHLVQNAEEFEGAVNDLSNSAGSATKMADIQQKSLANQIQVVKNALMAPFLLSSEVGKANGMMNEFGETLHGIVTDFESFFVHTLDDGTKVLTEQGIVIRDLVINTLKELGDLLKDLMNSFESLTKEGQGFGMVVHALLMPVKLLVKLIGLLGEGGLEAIIMFKTFNMILPLAEMNTYALQLATMSLISTDKKRIATLKHMAIAQSVSQGFLAAGMLLMMRAEGPTRTLGMVMIGLAGAIMAVNVALSLFGGKALTMGKLSLAGLAFASTIALAKGLESAMIPPKTYDMGGRIYDSGGSLGGRHFPVMVEPGETITSKTQNMLGGGGITLNIQGDIVTNDADDFAERIAVALPEALRRQNDMGGI